MRLTFLPAVGGGTRLLIRRGDGVTLEMRSYDRALRVPHDLAHAVTERELALRDGVFGCVAAGAVFSSVRVVAGSQRHDAAARSSRILKAAAHPLKVAEVLSGVLHDAVEGTADGPLYGPLYGRAREAWGVLEQRPFPYTAARLAAAARTLEALAADWSSVPPGGLEFDWPPALTAPVPQVRRRTRRTATRRGRVGVARGGRS